MGRRRYWRIRGISNVQSPPEKGGHRAKPTMIVVELSITRRRQAVPVAAG